MINQNDIIVQKKNIVSSSLDGEIVLMSLDNSSYYGLNYTASKIWSILENPKKIEEIVKILFSEYNVDYSLCEKETLQIVNDFYKNSLIDLI
ncbi:MAG: hypothetical protein A2033_08195 [Bacteroidetes bacterium GWA2_31_9]|nr:MAG: hypothetical protein A2033_08195 [Bacteroidetes bacterium GWA2_31_9]